MGFTGIGFENLLSRGVVLGATFDQKYLDNPHIDFRFKYFVVLNVSCPSDPTFFLYATSNLSRAEKIPTLKGDQVHLSPDDYDWLNRPTCLNFADVKSIPLGELRTLIDRRRLKIVRRLTTADLAVCDDVIRKSRQIQPRVKPLIVLLYPGAF